MTWDRAPGAPPSCAEFPPSSGASIYGASPQRSTDCLRKITETLVVFAGIHIVNHRRDRGVIAHVVRRDTAVPRI